MYARNMITFESLDIETSALRDIFREYGSSLYMKVIGSRSRSQPQKAAIPYSCCKTSI